MFPPTVTHSTQSQPPSPLLHAPCSKPSSSRVDPSFCFPRLSDLISPPFFLEIRLFRFNQINSFSRYIAARHLFGGHIFDNKAIRMCGALMTRHTSSPHITEYTFEVLDRCTCLGVRRPTAGSVAIPNLNDRTRGIHVVLYGRTPSQTPDNKHLHHGMNFVSL